MYDVLSKTRCTGNANKESVLDQWESSGKVYYSLEGVTQEWVDLACRESAIAKFYADIWQKLPASQSSWMHVYALRGGVTCMPVLLRKSIPNDRPTDRPTDPPTESRADAHDRAFSLSLSLSPCFLYFQPSYNRPLPRTPTASTDHPPLFQSSQHHENWSAGISCNVCRLRNTVEKVAHQRIRLDAFL